MRILTFYSFFVFGTAINDESWHQEYHSYDEIRDFFLDLSIENPHTRIIEDGNLFALMVWYHFYRIFPISNFKIGGKTYQNQQVNNGLLQIDCGTYGMDWISISICQFIAEKLVKEDSPYDILIFPVLNPDGYEYSRNTDRLWQKNYRRIGTRAYNIFLF